MSAPRSDAERRGKDPAGGALEHDPEVLAGLEKRLGYRFDNRALLARALIHRSAAQHRQDAGIEGAAAEHYERLEFLGDAVLGFTAADWLYRALPDRPEGELARRKSFLVSAPVLARAASELGLGEALLLAENEARDGGREKASLLADAFEAVLGAIYLDSDFETARRLARPIIARAWVDREGLDEQDAKTRLQELLQSLARPLPEYVVERHEGPEHARTFFVSCRIEGAVAGEGDGPSKKIAERRSALAALQSLEAPGGDG